MMSTTLGAMDTAKVQLFGRIAAPPNVQILTWPYSGLKFAFKGSEANLSFPITGMNAFSLSIDGGNATKIEADVSSSSSTASLTTGKLAQGIHVVEIHKVSEALYGTVTFTNQSITTDGFLLELARTNRKIEFVGDSITAGYGVDGTFPCTASTATENAGKTYAALVASSFEAEASLIAWSGRGVVRNYPDADGSDDNTPTMPVLWLQTNALDTTPTYTFPANQIPQVVVIALGTNDFAYLTGPPDASGNPTASRPPITLAQYQEGISNFTEQIFQKYSEATIFLTSSPMLSDGYPAGQMQHSTQLQALQNVAANSTKIFAVDFPAQGSQVGCDYHPTAATHQQMADILAPAIQKQLSW